MRNRFDLQLKQLNDDIIEMGNMIERAIEMGVYALIGHDTDKAKQTTLQDKDNFHPQSECRVNFHSAVLNNMKK